MLASGSKILDRSVGWLVIFNLVCLAALWIFTLWSAGKLPARYPIHFDAAGNANRWATAGSGEWFIPPGIATLMVIIIGGLGLAMPKIPLRLWSIPAKKKFLALSPERRAPLIRSVVRFVLGTGCFTALLFGAIQVQLFLLATGSIGQFLPAAVFVPIGVLVLYLIGWTVSFLRQVRLATREPSWGEQSGRRRP